MPYTKEQLLEKYKNLPQDVQDAIFSVDTSEIIREIGEKNKLMIDKIGELADETGLVMLGLTHPNEFISNLAERLEVERDIVKEIAEEINSKVFFPIRENLKKIHGLAPTLEEVGPPAGEAGAPIPPAPIESSEPEAEVGEISPVSPLPAPEPKIETPIPPEPKPEPALPTDKVVGTPTESVGAAPIESSEPTEDVGKITTPPMIMSMPIDLSKTQKTQAETETPPPPSIFEAETKEEVFRSLEKKIEKTDEKGDKSEIEKQSASSADLPKRQEKVDPYREPIS